MHGRGIDELLEATVGLLPEKARLVEVDDDEITIAIVGRPNVGKSQLLNTLTKEDRAIVSELPGTTRDPVDSLVEFDGRKIRLVDTAGIRRRGRIIPGLERFSVGRALQAISRSDVVVLVIDATEGVSAQDMHLAGFVDEQGKGLIVAVNKWDLVEDRAEARPHIEDWLRSSLVFARYFLTEFTSAKTGYHVERLFTTAALIHDSRRLQVPTSALNQVIQRASQRRRPASTRGRTLNIFYATQVDVAPPTFTVFVNDPRLAHRTYVRYLMNQIRRAWDFPGTPIKINLRPRPRTGNRADGH
jgi:GTP-binding protein